MKKCSRVERRNVYRREIFQEIFFQREIFQEVEKEVTIRKHVILYSPQIEKVQFFPKDPQTGKNYF